VGAGPEKGKTHMKIGFRTKGRRAALLVSLTVLAISAVAALMAVNDGEALAAGQVSCGDTITTDVTLHHNLVNCPNNGIIIGADDITLDLNYHTVDGDGTLTPGCNPETEFCDEGVVNLGHDGVTVVHGSVREFAFGADAGRVRHVRFLGISTSRNLFFGMVIFGSTRSVIRNGSSSRNIPPEGDGIGVFGSDHVRIVHNKIRRNPGPGIHVDDSNQNLIKGNVFSRNSPAILMGGDRNEVRRNRCARNDACVLVGPGSRNVIARNRSFKDVSSIAVEKGHGNLVARNVIVRPRRTGIYLAINSPPIGGRDNLIRRNFVRGSGEDAFLVRSEDRHSRLKRNVAVGAGEDGFDVRSRSAMLTKNRALRNADLGIEATRGVGDGGGNVARRNGDPRQCTHIACR
jgi:parallel beta-helix repeat protein